MMNLRQKREHGMTKRWRRRLATFSLVLIGCVEAAACSPFELVGRLAGGIAGREAAKAAPAPAAAIVIDPQGGNFCPVMTGMGWPPAITDDRLNDPLAGVIVDTVDHGVMHCGWKT